MSKAPARLNDAVSNSEHGDGNITSGANTLPLKVRQLPAKAIA